MRTSMSFGLILDSASQARFQRSSAPGRKFSIMMCESRASRRTISWPSGVLRSQVTDFLFRDCTCHQSDVPLRMRRHLRSGSPSPGGSILITSAPKSASVLAQNGPAMRLPSSRTRIPLRGPDMERRLCQAAARMGLWSNTRNGPNLFQCVDDKKGAFMRLLACSALLASAAVTAPAAAQETIPDHAALRDRFYFGLG